MKLINALLLAGASQSKELFLSNAIDIQTDLADVSVTLGSSKCINWNMGAGKFWDFRPLW